MFKNKKNENELTELEHLDSPETAPVKKKNSKLIVGIAAVLLLVVYGVGVFFYSGHFPQNMIANGKKIGHSSPSFFGGMNHYDNSGHKVGESRPGFFGGVNHYDDKGHKQGHSNPGFLGGFNHYDD